MTEYLPSQLAIVGLGYVGLPLAAAFSRVLPTIGFDINEDRIRELQNGSDRNGEVDGADLRVPSLELSSEPSQLSRADFVIIAVPTPVDRAKQPDLLPLIEASRMVGKNLSRGTTVVYESTVYPGCTQEVCIPVLEQASGLKSGVDFKVGYSPERVNPGDNEHTLENVKKIVAGQDRATGDLLAFVYGLVVKAGIHRAPDIRIAEAAKVIENVQRDLNIALMNELAMLFHRIGLDTAEVFNAARTKWNFLPFEAGLVGGHCIPVDPYYLTHKAQELGYHPQVILSGRRINDSMGLFIAQETVKLLIRAGKVVRGAKALILGAAFKPDVRDVRNTRVAELIHELENHGVDVALHDPLVSPVELQRFNVRVLSNPFKQKDRYDAVILAVPHRVFQDQPKEVYANLLKNGGRPAVFVDLKGVLRKTTWEKGVLYWSL